MKKILRISTMFLLVVFMSLGFAACKPTLTKINVDLDTIKTEYFVGEQQESYEDAEVYCVYSNGDLVAIKDKENITFSSISTAEVGTQTLTVTYKGKTQEISITVREKTVTAISVTGLKTAYVVGEAQNNACTVTATYEDGSTAVVPNAEVTFSTISTAEVGEETITVTYKGVSQNITVYVNEKAIERIEVDEETIFTEFFYGDEVSEDHFCEIFAIVYYDDGSEEEVYFDDLTFSDINTTPADLSVPQILTVSYRGVSTTVEITIKERIIESIEIVETGLKLSYEVGDAVDTYSNLKINIHYTNGTSDTNVYISGLTGVTLTKPTTEAIGESTLKVAYKGFEDTATVTVNEKSVKSVTLTLNEDEFIKGENYQDNVAITVTYADDSTKPLTVADVTFADSFNINKIGNQTLTVSYKGIVSNAVNVVVYGSTYDKYYVSEWSAPKFVTTYEENIARDSESNQGFYVNKNSAKFAGYVIGDDNPFIFMPTAKGYASIEDEISTPLTKLTTTFKVYQWAYTDETEEVMGWVELTGNDISYMVTIDIENATLDFTENAIGEKFKIEALPYFDSEGINAVSFNFTVKDGYNVYKEEELSLFDNMNYSITDPGHEDYVDGRLKDGVWRSFKEANGLWGVEVNGLFIHTDLHLEINDLSPLLFFQAGDKDLPGQDQSTYGLDIVGSYRDFTYSYQRSQDAGKEPFEFNGNYFTINAEDFPLIAFIDGGAHAITHSSLFWTEGEGDVNFKNTKFIGNAQRTDSGEEAGGLILIKISHGAEATFDNVLTITYGISYFTHYENATVNVNDCKGFDNYACFIYSYGLTTNNVNHSYFTGCGGPVAILAHEDPNDHPNNYGELNIDETSTIENFVTGGEPWFAMFGGGGLVNKIKPLADGINQASNYLGNMLKENLDVYDNVNFNKSFVRIRPGTENSGSPVEELNLIAVIMHSSGPISSSSNPIKGKVTLGDNSGVNLTNDPIHDAIHAQNAAAPIMQAGGKTIFTDGNNGFYKMGTSGAESIGADEVSFFMDDYIGVSVNLSMMMGSGNSRVGIFFGFFEL